MIYGKKKNKEVQPSTRRRLQGIVVYNKMQKTIVVETENIKNILFIRKESWLEKNIKSLIKKK